jgi:hypothetical protein
MNLAADYLERAAKLGQTTIVQQQQQPQQAKKEGE